MVWVCKGLGDVIRGARGVVGVVASLVRSLDTRPMLMDWKVVMTVLCGVREFFLSSEGRLECGSAMEDLVLIGR